VKGEGMVVPIMIAGVRAGSIRFIFVVGRYRRAGICEKIKRGETGERVKEGMELV